MALDTVSDYVGRARVLLQDTVSPYRYSDADLVENLNMAMLEARRLRPDLFIGRSDDLPDFGATSDSTAVDIDAMYRMALLYYICGQAQLRDEEDTQDARATIFLNKFVAQMLTIAS